MAAMAWAARAALAAALVAVAWQGVAGSSSVAGDGSDDARDAGDAVEWRKAAPYPPPPSLTQSPAGRRLRVHMWTIPAHGHYMTLRDVGVALAARGHEVAFVMCDRNREVYHKDDLAARGVGLVSAGGCASYDGYDAVMAALINATNLDTVGAMLDGVAALAQEMCAAAMPWYEAAAAAGSLPDVIVFDADTFCAMDVSVRHRIPRVPRVGTGPRDVYTTPAYLPQYGTAFPVAMTLLQRIANVLSIALSRLVISPAVLPRLQAARREQWASATVTPLALEGAGAAAVGVTPDGGVVAGGAAGAAGAAARAAGSRQPPVASVPPVPGDDAPDAFRVDIPWDGATTLYNSHWGLEYARPLAPYEHLIGHTTDFAREAATPLPPLLAAWLAAAPTVPVVYVGMGTLSIIGGATLAGLANAMSASTAFRFVWSVPTAQQALLPAALRAHSASWLADGAGTPQPPAPGHVLLLPWVPQLATLMHNMTTVFWTHGGMNGVAEGTYAHTPMLCTPLFSDQPDNCQRMQDFGFGVRLNKEQLDAGGVAVGAALAALHSDAAYRSAIHTAWVRNVAAGGIPRAVALIEAAVELGYGGHRHTIPRVYFMPAWQAYGLDIMAVAAVAAAAVGLCIRACVVACCRRRATTPAAK